MLSRRTDRLPARALTLPRGTDMREPIDSMFIQCVKEELADGERLIILVPSRDAIPAYERAFSDVELESITFRVDDGSAAGASR